MRADYPAIVAGFHEAGSFPPDILEQLQTLLDEVGNRPLIVRSSSLLEDNFGTSFAGKYDSVFCPNQGTPEENLHDLTRGHRPRLRLHAQPQRAALPAQQRAAGLRRAHGHPDPGGGGRAVRAATSCPQAAGVAFSRNLYRWSPQIREEDGFVRLVWGLGTRAVDRVGNDYPRLVALSHPLLRPSTAPKTIRRYSQQYVDLIDLEENTFKTLPVQEVLGPGLSRRCATWPRSTRTAISSRCAPA